MQIPAVSTPAKAALTGTASRSPDVSQASSPFDQVLARELTGQEGSSQSRPREKGDSAPQKDAACRSESVEDPPRSETASIDAPTGGATSQSSHPAVAKGKSLRIESIEEPGLSEPSVDVGDDDAAPPDASEDVLALISGAIQIVQPREEATRAPADANGVDSTTTPNAGEVADLKASTPVGLATAPPPELPARPGNTTVPRVLGENGDKFVFAAIAGEKLSESTHEGAAVTADVIDEPSIGAVAGRPLHGENRSLSLDAAFLARPVASHDAKSEGDAAVSGAQMTGFTPVTVEASSAFRTDSVDTLHPRVGTPAWETALGHKVTWMIGEHQQTATLVLDPPDLGPLQVVLTINSDQATAAFYAPEPEVRRALEAAIPRLREMLDAAGIQLGDATVGAGTSDNGDAPPTTRHLPPNVSRDSAEARPSAPDGGSIVRTVAHRLIDTFA